MDDRYDVIESVRSSDLKTSSLKDAQPDEEKGYSSNVYHLWPRVEGRAAYKRDLEDAASELYELLAEDVARRAASPDIDDVSKPGEKPKSTKLLMFVPRTRKDTVEALKTLLHSLAFIASAPSNSRAYVCISLKDSVYTSGDYSHLKVKEVRKVVYALAAFGDEGSAPWVRFYRGSKNWETGKGLRSRIAPERPMKDWMIRKGLIFVGHPHGIERPKKDQERSLLRLTDSVQGAKGRARKIKNSRPLDRPLLGDEMICPLNLLPVLFLGRRSLPWDDQYRPLRRAGGTPTRSWRRAA